MPSTKLTEGQLEICQKYLAEFREGDKLEKRSVLKKLTKEVILSIPDVAKIEKENIKMASDFHDSKPFSSCLSYYVLSE